jgi:uncharacterized membrane protein
LPSVGVFLASRRVIFPLTERCMTVQTAVGVFSDRAKAQQAVAELKRTGFRDDQIGVVTQKHDDNGVAVGKESGTKAIEGAELGMAAGAGVGVLWALGIAAAVFTLMAVLASAGAGAAVAGLLGALVGMGIPENEAKYYEGEIKAGRTLVTVKAGDHYDDAANTMRRFGGYDMATRNETGAVLAGAGRNT